MLLANDALASQLREAHEVLYALQSASQRALASTPPGGGARRREAERMLRQLHEAHEAVFELDQEKQQLRERLLQAEAFMARLRRRRAAAGGGGGAVAGRLLTTESASPLLLTAPPPPAADAPATPCGAVVLAGGAAGADAATPVFPPAAAVADPLSAPISPVLQRARDAPAAAARWAAVREELDLVKVGHKGLASGLARAKCALSVLGRQLTPSPMGPSPQPAGAAAAAGGAGAAGSGVQQPATEGDAAAWRKRAEVAATVRPPVAAAVSGMPPAAAVRPTCQGPAGAVSTASAAGAAQAGRSGAASCAGGRTGRASISGSRASSSEAASSASLRPPSADGGGKRPATIRRTSATGGSAARAPASVLQTQGSAAKPSTKPAAAVRRASISGAVAPSAVAAGNSRSAKAAQPGARNDAAAAPAPSSQASAAAGSRTEFAFDGGAAAAAAGVRHDIATTAVSIAAFGGGAGGGGADGGGGGGGNNEADCGVHSPVRSFAASLAACEADEAPAVVGGAALATGSVSLAPGSISCGPAESQEGSSGPEECIAHQPTAVGDDDGAESGRAVTPTAPPMQLSELLSLGQPTPMPAVTAGVISSAPTAASGIAVDDDDHHHHQQQQRQTPRLSGRHSQRGGGEHQRQSMEVKAMRESFSNAVGAIDWGSVLGVMSGAVTPPAVTPGLGVTSAAAQQQGSNFVAESEAAVSLAPGLPPPAAAGPDKSPGSVAAASPMQPDWQNVLGLLGCATPAASAAAGTGVIPPHSTPVAATAAVEPAVRGGGSSTVPPVEEAALHVSAGSPEPLGGDAHQQLQGEDEQQAEPKPLTGVSSSSAMAELANSDDDRALAGTPNAAAARGGGGMLEAMLFGTPTPAQAPTPPTGFSAAAWCGGEVQQAAAAGGATSPPSSALITQTANEEQLDAGEQGGGEATVNGGGGDDDTDSLALPSQPRPIRTRVSGLQQQAAAAAAAPIPGSPAAEGAASGSCTPYREFSQLRRRAIARAAVAAALGAGDEAAGVAGGGVDEDGLVRMASDASVGCQPPRPECPTPGSDWSVDSARHSTMDLNREGSWSSALGAAAGMVDCGGAAGQGGVTDGSAGTAGTAASGGAAGTAASGGAGGCGGSRFSRLGGGALGPPKRVAVSCPSGVEATATPADHQQQEQEAAVQQQQRGVDGGASAPGTATTQGALLDHSAQSVLLTPSAQVQLLYTDTDTRQQGQVGTAAVGAVGVDAVTVAANDSADSGTPGSWVSRVRMQQQLAGTSVSAAAGGSPSSQPSSPLARSLSGLLEKYRRQAEQTAAVLSGISTACARADQEQQQRWRGAQETPLLLQKSGGGDGGSKGAAPVEATPAAKLAAAAAAIGQSPVASSIVGSVSFGGIPGGDTPASVPQPPASSAASGSVQALLDMVASLTPLPAAAPGATAAAATSPAPPAVRMSEQGADAQPRRSVSPYAALDTQSLLQLALSPSKRRVGGDLEAGAQRAGGGASIAGEIRALLVGRRDQAAAVGIKAAGGVDTEAQAGSSAVAEGTQTTPMLSGRGGGSGGSCTAGGGGIAAVQHGVSQSTQVTPSLRGDTFLID